MDRKREFIPGARPTFHEEDLPQTLAEISEVLRSGRMILGPKLKRLEEEWAASVGTKHAIGVSSCTAALEIAFRYLAVGGREVIVPTNTFVATANAARAAGGNVVFSDMSADDYCLDVDDAISRMSDNTAAVVVVHISGFIPAQFDDLKAECQRRSISIIEDCAHAQGASLGGRQAGALGDIGCFSLYPTKILTCGVGGVLTTNDDQLAAFARSLRHHGQGGSLEEIVHAGNDWMLDEVRAVLAYQQLRRLEEFLAHRRGIARVYDELLAGDGRFTLPKLGSSVNAAYYKYPVLIPSDVDGTQVRRRMREEENIEVGAIYYPPCHLMPVFRQALGTGPGQLPTAERLLARQVCLPMHARVTSDEARESVAALQRMLA